MEHENDLLMPRDWTEYVGQTALKDQLEVSIRAAYDNERTLGHVLLYGPPGYGKTSLASLIASRMGDPFFTIDMPAKAGELERLFEDWRGGVLFMDEIHRASKSQQEDLLPLLEKGIITIGSRTFEVPWLTVVGATTDRDKVIEPLYDRFLDVAELDPYEDDEMVLIVKGLAAKANLLELDDDDALVLARAAAGTPRWARRLVLKYRDLIEAGREATGSSVLALMRIDEDGLTKTHKSYLECLDSMGGVAGLSTLAGFLRLHELTVRELERQLVKLRLVTLTPRGRRITGAGRRRLRGEADESTFVRRRHPVPG